MPTTNLNGADLYWEMTGPEGAPLLVMVHGAWSDHHDFDLIAPLLAADFRVLTYDRRGHSRSGAPPGQGSVNEDVGDLAALIGMQGRAAANVLGHSAGATITMKLAIARPDLILRLAVHEPPLTDMLEGAGDARAAAGLEGVARLIAAGQNAEAARAFIDEVVYAPGTWETLPEPDRAMLTRNAPTFLDDLRDPESRRLDLDGLAGFSKPFLLSQGTTSAAFFADSAALVRRALPRGRYETINGANHQPHLTHVETYSALLTDFFREG